MEKLVKQKFLPIILVILDGWGIAPASVSNPISVAKTPTIDFFMKNFPNCQLTAHGKKVGLLNGQDGNSEAGHMNIGSGRIVKQDSVMVSDRITDGTFFKNTAIIEAINHAKKYKSNIHVMGLLSNGQSAHSQPEHLYALLELLKQRKFDRIYLHLFTDGRDSSPHATSRLIIKLISQFKNNEIISTIIGRFYAMDRIKAWHRTELAYNAMVNAEGVVSDNPHKAISEAYDRGETDEYITPTIILNPQKKAKFINNNDAVIFFNLRSDRARQLTKPLVQKDFEKRNPGSFKRKKVLKNIKFVAMADFGPDLDSVLTAYPSIDIQNTLPYELRDFKQLYVSEREKYAHVTYFFNGGHSKPVNGEKWQVIPSVGKGNYVNHPQMSSHDLTGIILKNIAKQEIDFLTVNYPNADMLGHTGNVKAAIKAVEVIDSSLCKIYKKICEVKGTMIITADHGNIEEMINLKTGEMDTEHSTNPVPFILINRDLKHIRLRKTGILADVAPTIMQLFKVKKTAEMTGKSLIISKKI
ncbi:2,3-bisphosphoglycerate-independent phosphoglycerate mutase [Patescibacteria group bacterium]